MKFCDNPKCRLHVDVDEEHRTNKAMNTYEYNSGAIRRRLVQLHEYTKWVAKASGVEQKFTYLLCDDCDSAVKFMQDKERGQ